MTLVILADAHPEVRTALRLFLETSLEDLNCIETGNAMTLLAQAVVHCPEVVLLDADLAGPAAGRGGQGRQTLGEAVLVLRTLCPTAQIIILSAQPGLENWALRLGAQAFFSKNDAPTNLLEMIGKLGVEV
jgi:DNA-binding NarL/FixJ family response regulator